MATAIPPRQRTAEDVWVSEDARVLARIHYGAELAELRSPRSHPARAHIAWLLCSRGYTQRTVARVLCYADHTTLSYHLKKANAALAAGRWPFSRAKEG